MRDISRKPFLESLSPSAGWGDDPFYRSILHLSSPIPITRPAFSLLELLIVMAILSVLLGLLLPALSGARCEATKAKCLSNMRALSQGLATYSIDDEKGFTTPVHPKAETSWLYDGEYEYGGQTGLLVYGHRDFVKQNRILNQTLFGASNSIVPSLFQCPNDQGIPSAPVDFDAYFFRTQLIGKTVFQVTGTSYRLNNHIDFLSQTRFNTRFYGPYLRPRTRVPDPGQTVILEEAVAEVAKWNTSRFVTRGWHCKPNRFNVAFVDGHAEPIRIAGQNHGSSSDPDYWILRGPGWRMDCYPDPPVLDLPRPE